MGEKTFFSKNQQITLQITGISNDGNGVGRYEGKAVFVPGAAIEDTLRVKIVKDSKQFAYGRIEQIVAAGKGRQKMDCPIGDTCGGCCFRHLSYPAELEAKRDFIQSALQRIGKLQIEVPPVLPSPHVDRYRNKVQYPVFKSECNMISYGFFAARSHRIVPCENCLLQPETLNAIAAKVAAILTELGVSAYDEITHSGLVRHIYLRQGVYSGQVMVCIVTTSEHFPQQQSFVGALLENFSKIKTIILNVNPDNTNVILGDKNIPLYGDGYIEDTLCGVPVRLGPLSFSQVNTHGAEILFSLVKQFANLHAGETLLDMYCGAGVIGLSLAGQTNPLIGVEIVPEAVHNARLAAEKMDLHNTRFLCEDAGKAALRLSQEGIHPDVITIDPPRKGCDNATLQAILAMAPKRIVMVSCNPTTMARDLAALEAGGYAIQQVQPVDLFPRTKHVECVATLHRCS